MTYRAIGLMSGSSLDGLDIVFAEFLFQSGKWSYSIKAEACYPYENEWQRRLAAAKDLPAYDYMLLHVEYGHYLGRQVNRFIDENQLHFQPALIASHGHTVFHAPEKGMTAQLGDGAALAAETGFSVVSDLRSMDLAFGGQGAPIVPIGEKLLLGEYEMFLNIGGIANVSFNSDPYLAFDICPANRVLNLLAAEAGHEYDDNGGMAKKGNIDEALLTKLDALEYYGKAYPKSLSNEFGTETVYSIIKQSRSSLPDRLHTYTEHIARQIANAIVMARPEPASARMLITGGGAFNGFLVERIQTYLKPLMVDAEPGDPQLVQYKEALIMAFIGVLRWRQEENVLGSVTGARRDNVGGALWNP